MVHLAPVETHEQDFPCNRKGSRLILTAAFLNTAETGVSSGTCRP
jgi:hypothetical protein